MGGQDRKFTTHLHPRAESELFILFHELWIFFLANAQIFLDAATHQLSLICLGEHTYVVDEIVTTEVQSNNMFLQQTPLLCVLASQTGVDLAHNLSIYKILCLITLHQLVPADV